MDLFGTPGQKRFIPTLKAFAEDAMGIVVVVDSADPENFDSAAKMLKGEHGGRALRHRGE